MSLEQNQVQKAPVKGEQIARGVALMVAFKLVDKSIGLVSTLILARVLTPGDFGLVAMATAVVALTELMGAFGFDSALIQRQDAQKYHYNTAWTFNVLFGLAIAFVLLLLAIPAAEFYREPRLSMMLPVLAFGALVGGFENIGTVAFRKELNFKKEFHFLLAKRMTAFTVTVTLALIFRSYWALIAGIVTGKLMSVLISYLLHSYRPGFTLAGKSDLLNFSKWLFISNLIQFLHSRSTDFILGRTVGSHGLGIYNIGVEIAVMPSTELIAPINRAIYPVYSRLSSDYGVLQERFFQVFGFITLVAFPVSAGLASVAEPAVKVLLGDQWLDTIPIIRLISVSGLAAALQSNLYLMILALGHPKANTQLSACLLLVSLPTVVLASIEYGSVGAATAHCLISIIGLMGISLVFRRITGIRLRHLALLAWRPILASIIMALSIICADDFLSSAVVSLRLMMLIAIGVSSYIISLVLLWGLSGRPRGAEIDVINSLRGKLGSSRQRS